jgi:hypothetical protein
MNPATPAGRSRRPTRTPPRVNPKIVSAIEKWPPPRRTVPERSRSAWSTAAAILKVETDQGTEFTSR